MEEESRMVKAVSVKKQGNWLNWEGARQQKCTYFTDWMSHSVPSITFHIKRQINWDGDISNDSRPVKET
ncbi:Hypothetical predicted protein [Mytilus galloprovincialis]|uniref:Uncharacterized protein n=1 Tax=Mytilus galloprovincialis TaxID=29158 RepID=A0A8B6C5D1_MYTGA|nr:Hypothetical predicted protein [Mytilus galloprovincialis]